MTQICQAVEEDWDQLENMADSCCVVSFLTLIALVSKEPNLALSISILSLPI